MIIKSLLYYFLNNLYILIKKMFRWRSKTTIPKIEAKAEALPEEEKIGEIALKKVLENEETELSEEDFFKNFKVFIIIVNCKSQDLYIKEKTSTHLALEEYLERIKIVEMKVTHISKSLKNREKSNFLDQENGQNDLDTSKDILKSELTESIKSHFEIAFTEALGKLESYGNLIEVITSILTKNQNLQSCMEILTEKINKIEENTENTKNKSKSSKEEIIGVMDSTGKNNLSEIPDNILEDFGGERKSSFIINQEQDNDDGIFSFVEENQKNLEEKIMKEINENFLRKADFFNEINIIKDKISKVQVEQLDLKSEFVELNKSLNNVYFKEDIQNLIKENNEFQEGKFKDEIGKVEMDTQMNFNQMLTQNLEMLKNQEKNLENLISEKLKKIGSTMPKESKNELGEKPLNLIEERMKEIREGMKRELDSLKEEFEEKEDEREASENKREKKELERQLNEGKREQNERQRIDEELERVKRDNIREDKLNTVLINLNSQNKE